MNNTPAEVLQKIFLLLHQRDKVECMTVCRLWKYVIEDYVLFHTVCLYNKQQFDNFISKSRQDPRQSENIKRLIIDMKHIESSEMDILPLVVLNLHELYFYERVLQYDLRFTKALSPHPWSKSIRKIMEESASIFTMHILKEGVCPALTEISMNGTSIYPRKKFIELLVNTPSLKSLSLNTFSLSLDDLELLHSKVSSLSSFSIQNSQVDCSNLPTEIQPAMCMTKLSMEQVSVSTNSTYISFQEYLTDKYPLITEMMYHVTATFYSSANVEYNINTGFDMQIKQIGRQLKSLRTGWNTHLKYIIPVLDKNNCEIKELSIYLSSETPEVGQLMESAQAKHIQSLSLNNISDGRFINQLTALPVLTEVNLYCVPCTYQLGRRPINLNKLLEKVGTNLITLRVSHAKLALDRLSAQEYPSLRYLAFHQTTIPKCADHFISKSFPKLTTLIMDDISRVETTFYLGNLNLVYAELRTRIPSVNPYVLIVTTTNNEKRWYTARPVSKHRRDSASDSTVFPAVKSFSFDKSNSLPHKTFMFNSVQEFFLVNISKSLSS